MLFLLFSPGALFRIDVGEAGSRSSTLLWLAVDIVALRWDWSRIWLVPFHFIVDG